MDKGDKSSGGLPGGGFIVMALLTAGVLFVANRPLESSRPPQPEQRVERHQAAQDVDARLWQDPLGAVAKSRDLAAKKPGATAADEFKQRNEKSFAQELQRQSEAAGPGGVAVFAVMVSGGPYAERVESRLRLRYAVLAGMAARGFVPVDNEHLGYFLTDANTGLPEVVPFERFASTANDGNGNGSSNGNRNRKGNGRNRGDDCQGCRVLVLWLDSADFYERPLQKLAGLAQRVSPNGLGLEQAAKPVRWRVLGPSSSDGLRAMVVEVDDKDFNTRLLAPHDMRFFSGAATVDDDVLLQRAAGQPATLVSDRLRSRGVQFLRTIGNDDVLARALVQELKQRGLQDAAQVPAAQPGGTDDICNTLLDPPTTGAPPRPTPPSSIAIVSEWDTLYGRSLRQGFRYDSGRNAGFCMTRWNYVRGLDGRLPGDSQPSGADSGRGQRDSRSESTAGDGSYFERPEGQSQFDYLRRLAGRMQEEDATLRRLHGASGGIRAVGVLGNDVYDKLLVLQALQPALPHAIFFTTDLDARLFHPTEQAWARNLVVASNFGLRLSGPLQRGFAPFRDSYQTSAYLTTMVAMDDLDAVIAGQGSDLATQQSAVARWFAQPRVLEISRSGTFDYSPAAAGSASMSASASASSSTAATAAVATSCDRWHLERCNTIHPPPSSMVPTVPLSARFLLAAPLLLALWAPPVLLSRRSRRRLRRFVGQGDSSGWSRGARAGTVVIAALLLATLPPLLLAWTWPAIGNALTAGGKPMSLNEGISPWPTYTIRLLTLVLCLHFVVRAWSSLGTNVDRIAREFRLGATRRNYLESLAYASQHHPGWRAVWAMFSVRFYRERPGRRRSSGGVGMTASAIEFWKHYLLQNRAVARVLRTACWVVLMVLFSLLVSNALGDQPEAPLRGGLTRTMQGVSSVLPGIAALFLIFFVVDATLLCVFFVRGLRLHRSNWPPRTLQVFQRATGVPPEYLEDWIDINFVARRTRAIAGLVYFPFIVLSLLMLARSSFFDDWYTPPSTVVLAGISFAIVLGCAFALRRTAEASRTQGVEKLRDAILRAKGEGKTALTSQLELLRDRMEKMGEGAFAPYSRQPLLRAVLLPLLTFGGSSLFDYLTLINL